MVVGSLIFMGVSMVASIAYACGLVREMTKLVCWEELSFRMCDMMYAPSGVGMSVGVALRWAGVTTVSDERKEMAISTPCVRAW